LLCSVKIIDDGKTNKRLLSWLAKKNVTASCFPAKSEENTQIFSDKQATQFGIPILFAKHVVVADSY
jgi:hypothetical protein